MARFPHVRAAFNQTAFIESLNLPHAVLADIWLPVGFPPVSFEPLGEEEEKVAVSGQFSNSNVRSRNNANYTPAGDHRGNRNNPRQQSTQTGGQNRSRGNSFTTSSASRSEYQHQPRHFREKDEEDVIEDPDNLWATPTSDTFGTSDFGTFDENGMFRAGGSAADLNTMGALEDFASSSAAFEGFMQTRPHHMNAPVAVAPVVPPVPAAPLSPPVAIPHITPDTQWLYRDPSGQIQGPFPSHRMIEWYNGKYFPENLPLRREQDPFFEPLSTWKTKCAGQVPFIAYAKTPEPATASAPAPVSLGFSSRHSVPVSQWFTSETKREPEPVVKPVEPVVASTRSVPIESLFSLPAAKPQPQSQQSAEKSVVPEVTMPTAAAGWKKLEKPSIATKFGQLDINEPPTPSEQPVKAESIKFEESAKPSSVPAPAQVPITSAPLATSSWSNSSASNGSLKKISLSEILRNNEEPVKTQPAPSAVAPATTTTAAAAAGWAKLSASPVQSLSTIQAEEASRQREASVSGSSASKSFADLVRSAGVITSGNIVVSPVVSDRPTLESKAPTSPPVTSAPVNSKPKDSVTSVPVKPAATSNGVVSIEDWCMSSLRQSPSLSKSIDPQTCTILLLDLPNPPAILTFALETLKPLETGSFDLASFAQELSIRKFGQKATEKVQWSKLKAAPLQRKQEESFEVVKRKK